MKINRLFALLLISFTSFANADLVGSWSIADSQTIKVHYKDDNHIRMDVGNGTYMLIVGPKAYSVMNQGGQLMVMDLAAMGGVMKAFNGQMNQEIEQNIEQYDPGAVKFTKTGKTETVAGYKGQVYQVTIQGPKGQEKAEFVASSDPDVIKFQRAFIQVSERMMKLISSQKAVGNFNEAAEIIAKNKMGGLLRYSNDMTLASLKNIDVDSSTYELPKNAIMMSIPSFGR